MCWHKWSKWATQETGTLKAVVDTVGLMLPENERYVVGKAELQRRECEKCGKSQLRSTRA